MENQEGIKVPHGQTQEARFSPIWTPSLEYGMIINGHRPCWTRTEAYWVEAEFPYGNYRPTAPRFELALTESINEFSFDFLLVKYVNLLSMIHAVSVLDYRFLV